MALLRAILLWHSGSFIMEKNTRIERRKQYIHQLKVGRDSFYNLWKHAGRKNKNSCNYSDPWRFFRNTVWDG
jgi:hypothetical protein